MHDLRELIGLLREDNIIKVQDKITDLIISDFENLVESNYLFELNTLHEMTDDIEKEIAEKFKTKLSKEITKKISESIPEISDKIAKQIVVKYMEDNHE